MDKLQFTELFDATDPRWNEVGVLFLRMYREMEGMGLMLPLAPGGESLWIRMAQNTAGKFGMIVLAQSGDNVVGFAHGMIRFLPDYLGGHPIGSVTHAFVEEGYRDVGAGRGMASLLEKWFHDRNVHSVELQVIHGNPGATAFWEKLGFAEELRQYRKKL